MASEVANPIGISMTKHNMAYPLDQYHGNLCPNPRHMYPNA